MGKCVERIPHECGSKRGLQVFLDDDGSYNGYCFACNTVVKDPYGDKPEGYKPTAEPKDPEKVKKDVNALARYPIKGITDRGITEDTCKHYGIRVGLSEANGTDIISHLYPYFKKEELKGWKVRITSPKNFFGVGDTTNVEPFGWSQALKVSSQSPRIYITEGECFTGETEVLTPRGWRRFDELEEFERVAQVHPEVGTIEFVKPIGYVKKESPEGLVHHSVKGYEIITTGGHNMAYIDYKGDWVKRPANTRPSSGWKIPRVGYLNGCGIRLNSAEIALTLAICADSKIDVRKSGSLYVHFGFKKERKTKRLLGLLKALDIKYTHNRCDKADRDYISFTAPNYIKGKRIPEGWVSDATLEQRQFILDELVHWDGNSVKGRNQTEFSSKHKEEVDKVQLIAHTSGRVSTIMKRENKFGQWYKVSILHDKQTTSCQQLKQDVVKSYEEFVYCVTVPTGYIMVRHNDKVSVCGNCDAASLFQVIKNKEGKPPAVISIKSGASSISKLAPYIKDMKRMFKDIIYVGDNDEAGALAAKEIAKLCPEILIAKLPLKDCNEMLLANREDELYKCVKWDAVPPTSGKSVRSDDVWHLAEYDPEQGIDWPWPTATEMTRGIRRGEVYYFGSGVKMGKSVIVNEIATHLIKVTDTPVFLVKPEEGLGGTLKRLAGTAVNRIFYDPKMHYTKEDFERGKSVIGNKAVLYDIYQDVKWEEVKQEIRYNVQVLGCKDVFLDPLTCFTVGVSSGEANDKLITIASEFAGLAKELEFTGYVFCHLNNPHSGAEHNRGGKVLSSQFAGSRAMARFCHLMIGMECNKDPELPEEERNMRKLVWLEDRNFGESGIVHLFYNKNTGRLLEPVQHNEEVI